MTKIPGYRPVYQRRYGPDAGGLDRHYSRDCRVRCVVLLFQRQADRHDVERSGGDRNAAHARKRLAVTLTSCPIHVTVDVDYLARFPASLIFRRGATRSERSAGCGGSCLPYRQFTGDRHRPIRKDGARPAAAQSGTSMRSDALATPSVDGVCRSGRNVAVRAQMQNAEAQTRWRPICRSPSLGKRSCRFGAIADVLGSRTSSKASTSCRRRSSETRVECDPLPRNAARNENLSSITATNRNGDRACLTGACFLGREPV